MARAHGARARLALAFETIYGTAPEAGWWQMPFVSSTLGAEQPLLASELLGDGRDPQPAVIIIQPGEYTVPPETVIPANCALYGYDLRVTKLRLPIGQEENNMFLLSNGCKARRFTFTGLRHEPYTLAGGPPKKGYAFAFKPGEIITRSPYIADCSQLHSFSQDQMVLPIEKSAGNPLMPRGGGNLLADGSVLAPSSPLRSVVVDSFTAINLTAPQRSLFSSPMTALPISAFPYASSAPTASPTQSWCP